ncbi:MAG: acyl-CoA dehydrogenase family protein, partial [Pseudomonadota bacterium]|nr:acyl-CoA dehydrogenase family protein [Pseudomonadota bacterium]
MDTSQLIIDTAEKIFTDHCDKSLWDATEQGVFPCDLWRQLVENGFHQLGSANSGTETKDLFAFLKVCGRYAAPLPMAEILLANRWLGASAPAQGFASIGTQAGDSLVQVAWGRQVSPVLSVEAGSHDVSVFDAATLQQRGANLAGEPRDTMVAGAVSRRIELEDLPYAQMALARTNLMAGCLQAVLDLGLQFAAERSQFGRSISKFQAIQHSLAVVGTEVAASQRAADAGVDAMGTDRFEQEVAAAKARVGEAVGIVAEQVHQVHGAMGYTYEHRLHHFTR